MEGKESFATAQDVARSPLIVHEVIRGGKSAVIFRDRPDDDLYVLRRSREKALNKFNFAWVTHCQLKDFGLGDWRLTCRLY